MENAFLSVYLTNLIWVMAYVTGIWLLSLKLQDASIMDIFWGPGFAMTGWVTFFVTDGFLGRKLLVAMLVTLWGLRLGIHIAARNLGKGEDPRYKTWRSEHGKNFWWVSLFKVFLLQGILLWVISLGVQSAQIYPSPDHLVWLDVLGTCIWCVGFFFEAAGDWQLQQFKSNPDSRGKVMDRGLWRYTRHPNYFGESLIWWGLFVISIAHLSNLWTVISPIVITFLLLRVSGVSLLEKDITERRPKYRDYIERTSAFIPWFPKRNNRV